MGVELALKWPGNKWGRLAERAAQILGLSRDPSEIERPHIAWMEPFLGGAGLTFWLLDQGLLTTKQGGDQLFLSDASITPCSVHQAVRDAPGELWSALCELPWDAEWRHHYAELRADFNALAPEDRRASRGAALAIWLSRACTNGLWRVNQKGEMNQSRGRYVELSKPSMELLRRRSQQLAPRNQVHIRQADWRKAAEIAMVLGGQRRILVLDPPYIPLSATSKHTHYTRGGFDEEEQWCLSRFAREALLEQGFEVLVFGQNLPLMRALYPPRHFRHHAVPVFRKGACKGTSRASIQEVIVHGVPR